MMNTPPFSPLCRSSQQDVVSGPSDNEDEDESEHSEDEDKTRSAAKGAGKGIGDSDEEGSDFSELQVYRPPHPTNINCHDLSSVSEQCFLLSCLPARACTSHDAGLSFALSAAKVDFEFFDLAEIDFHGIRALLNRYLDGDQWDLSGMADALIAQASFCTGSASTWSL